MSADALVALSEIRAFVEGEILDTVPTHLRGELRAALKLLDEVAAELDRAYPLLEHECRELLALIDAADRALGNDTGEAHELAQALVSGSSGVCELDRLHGRIRALTLVRYRGVCGATETAIIDERDGDELRARFLDTLADHASRRAAWQSVFPVGSDPTERQDGIA